MNIKYDEYDETHVTAMLNCTAREQYALDIKGCPMGRGNSRLTAHRDLVRRIKIESGIDITENENITNNI